MLSILKEKGKTVPLDPYYAAQWSTLARKIKAELLLLFLYYIAKKHQLDITTILVQRLLIGWVDCSISNKILITVFKVQVQDKLKHDRVN